MLNGLRQQITYLPVPMPADVPLAMTPGMSLPDTARKYLYHISIRWLHIDIQRAFVCGDTYGIYLKMNRCVHNTNMRSCSLTWLFSSCMVPELYTFGVCQTSAHR